MLHGLRRFCGWAVVALVVSGCEPAIPEQDLGHVIYELPEVSADTETQPATAPETSSESNAGEEPGANQAADTPR